MSAVQIHGYHAHVYFDVNSLEQARELCESAAEQFSLRMGRFHQKLVGPHQRWSCQLAFRAELFAEVLPWLLLNRGELVIFIHPITGNELVDHRDRALWMGAVLPLDLSVLSESAALTDDF
jgi:aromatic ring-cleaving dioxygenase